MQKKLLFGLFLIALFSVEVSAQWISLDNNRTTNTPPEITILSEDEQSTILKIDITGFELKEFEQNGETFNTVDLLTDVFSTDEGSPELPYISNILAIPDYASLSVEVIESAEPQFFSNIHIAPARASWYEGDPEPDYIKSPIAYASSTVYPADVVDVERPSVFRDFRITRLSVFPVRYNASTKELQAVSSITVKLNYGRGVAENPKTTERKSIAPSFAKLYRGFIMNYQSVLDNLYDGNEDGREVMLCIMPDEFTESFQEYADWKRQTGTDIHITSFSDIGANSNNPDIIKDHIADAYHNWEYPPTYVLIVGDNNVFPKKIVTYPDYSFPTEDYFVEVDGDDFFPEMMIGRFTNQGDYRMRVMTNKFMLYEQQPFVEETDWFKKGICCSNNDYESQVYTKRYAAELMKNDGGFTTVDTLMSDGDGWGGGGCSMNLNDILGAINEGRSWLNYRGEGWVDGWSANCYNFNTSDVSSLNNGQKFTFVTSIGCGVAKFDAGGGNCFGEEWVQLGSLDYPRGGIAFVGPTSNTHTTYNNRIDKGIYKGMFVEDMDTPGQALLRGKLYMYNVFGADYYCEYHYKVFCVLGDPSIHIWKEVPLEVDVTYDATVPVGFNQPKVTVNYLNTGNPVANAQVTFTNSEIFATGFTDENGDVFIGITPEAAGELIITVRGGDVIPYQGTINIIQDAEHIGPDEYPLLIDIDGNTDGLVNPNENLNMTFTLKNWGTQTANNVTATLFSESADVEIVTDSPVSFGSINSGATTTGDPFQVYVKPMCPLNTTITLKLTVTSGSNSWDYLYNVEAVGCKLRYRDYIVNDEGASNRNYRMDPGETVTVYINTVNLGQDVAEGVHGVLRTDDPYITIIDSVGSFGSIPIGTDAINIGNEFLVSVSPTCPAEYSPMYSIKLSTWGGNYPYETIREFSIPVATPMADDFTGPDAYGYYAYESNDTLYEQSPEYDWVEIKDLGTEISLPGNQSDYTTTIDIPFSFQYYGNSYDELRVSTDGWIAFGSGNQTSSYNSSLPHADNINNMVAVFWDDLYHTFGWNPGEIYYYNDAANHRFIIEWDSLAHNENSYDPKREVFQAILLDPGYYPTATGDGEIICQYSYVSKLSSFTLGIENENNDIGLQYVYNSDYDNTVSSLKNGVAVKFSTEGPLMTVDINEPLEAAIKILKQNYPNPFTGSTRINFNTSSNGHHSLKVYNMRGEVVRTLVNKQISAGNYSVVWNGLNDSGSPISSGVYFYRLQTGEFVETMKMFKLN